jgi:metacaspase-1
MAKKALIVAINAYASPNQLRGQINDGNDDKLSLAARGFANISTLYDAQATRAAILNALTSIVKNAAIGDSIFFAFHGHGSWFNGPFGRAECICPIDWQTGFIADYELAAIFAQIKPGVNCDVVLGCCFAGTGTSRLMASSEKDYRKALTIPGPLLYKGIKAAKAVAVSGMNHVLWAACGKLETAWEVMYNGEPRGLYPVFWNWAIRNYPTYRRSQVDALIAPKVTAIVATQHPQVEGTGQELAEVPFT